MYYIEIDDKEIVIMQWNKVGCMQLEQTDHWNLAIVA